MAIKVDRQRHFSGLPSEEQIGYCRAIRIGDRVSVSGTTALAPGGGVAPEHQGNMYAQTQDAIRRIDTALAAFDLSLENVVSLLIHVTDQAQIAETARALGEAFRPIKPTSTLVGTPFLFHPDLLVEITAEAVA